MILICGVGRSGKTTYSRRYSTVVHLDALGHIPERYERANAIVSDSEDIVVEGIYGLADQRQKLLEAYHGKEKRCIWLDTPRSEVEERMRKDGIPVSTNHFDFEPPTYDEGWDEIWVVQNDGKHFLEKGG